MKPKLPHSTWFSLVYIKRLGYLVHASRNQEVVCDLVMSESISLIPIFMGMI